MLAIASRRSNPLYTLSAMKQTQICACFFSGKVKNRSNIQFRFGNAEGSFDAPQLFVGRVNLFCCLIRICDVPLQAVPLLIIPDTVVIDDDINLAFHLKEFVVTPSIDLFLLKFSSFKRFFQSSDAFVPVIDIFSGSDFTLAHQNTDN